MLTQQWIGYTWKMGILQQHIAWKCFYMSTKQKARLGEMKSNAGRLRNLGKTEGQWVRWADACSTSCN